VVKSNEDVLGVVSSTPGEVVIAKSKNDVLVECTKAGYEKARKKDHSDYALTGIGNMVLGQFSFVGSALDSLTGASNKYDSRVFLELEKETAQAQQPVAQQAAPVTPVSQQTLSAPDEERRRLQASIPFVQQVQQADDEEERNLPDPVMEPAILQVPQPAAPPVSQAYAQVYVMQPVALQTIRPIVPEAETASLPELPESEHGLKPPYAVQ
jgi:hypothetical protein